MNKEEAWMILKEGYQGQWSTIDTKAKHTFALRGGNTTKARLAVLKTRKMDGQRYPISYQEYVITGTQVIAGSSNIMLPMLWEIYRPKLPPYELLQTKTEINKTSLMGWRKTSRSTENNIESYRHLGFVEDYKIMVTSKRVRIERYFLEVSHQLIMLCITETGTVEGTVHGNQGICERNGTYTRIGLMEVRDNILSCSIIKKANSRTEILL